MEQIPHIAMFCQEPKVQLAVVVPSHLLPMVVKYLTDSNNQVRKTSQAALLVLLEQGLVERSDVQEQVCPVIIKLTEAESLDDYRTEAVAVSLNLFLSLSIERHLGEGKRRMSREREDGSLGCSAVKDMGSEMFEFNATHLTAMSSAAWYTTAAVVCVVRKGKPL